MNLQETEEKADYIVHNFKPNTQKGEECRDMIIYLRAFGKDLDYIAEAIADFFARYQL
jgi:hypothetical protein